MRATRKAYRDVRNEHSQDKGPRVKRLEYLRSFLRFCQDSGWIDHNAAQVLKPPKVTSRPTLPFDEGEMALDLGFSPAEAERPLLRSRLMMMVTEVVQTRGLTQAQAARLFGVSQPRVSDVVRGRVSRFTIDALVEMLARAGVRLEIVPLPASAEAKGRDRSG